MRSLREIFSFTRGESIAIALLLSICLIGGGVRLIQHANEGIPPELILRSLGSRHQSTTVTMPKQAAEGTPETQHRSSKTEGNPEQSESRVTSNSLLLVNINTASADSFAMLPFVGPALSKRIVEYRDKHGPYQSVDQLVAVYGIGPKNIEKIRPYLICK